MEVLLPLLIAIFVGATGFCVSRYKRCPSDKVIVVYGKGTGAATSKCIHGGGVFIMPVIQDYGVLSLEPMITDIDLRGTLSKGNIRVAVPATFTFGVSTDPRLLQNAAKGLLSRTKNDIISILY